MKCLGRSCVSILMQARLANHQCRSITVVIPAYMPNEEDILMDSLAAYRTEQSKYPGEFRVMLVWNSPDEHPEMEEMLEQLQTEWPELSVHRNKLSTTKCDNLNMAIEMLETDFALLLGCSRLTVPSLSVPRS